VLEAKGLQPEVVDLNRVYYSWLQDSNRDNTDFCSFAGDYFAARDFDLFGFSTVCSSYPLTLRIAAEVKRVYPKSTVVLGGPQASVVDIATIARLSLDRPRRAWRSGADPSRSCGCAGGDRALDAVPRYHISSAEDIVRNRLRPGRGPGRFAISRFHLLPDVRHCRHFPLELGAAVLFPARSVRPTIFSGAVSS